MATVNHPLSPLSRLENHNHIHTTFFSSTDPYFVLPSPSLVASYLPTWLFAAACVRYKPFKALPFRSQRKAESLHFCGDLLDAATRLILGVLAHQIVLRTLVDNLYLSPPSFLVSIMT